jgi:hypothetical protein
MTYKDGTMYSGEWMDGKRNGEGIQKYTNNSERAFYKGSWKNDFEEGEGFLIYINGDRYQGSLIKGLRHGKGFLAYGDDNENDRLSFDGEWKEDNISGNGTLKWKAGDSYIGEFKNGLRHGKGVLTYSEKNDLGVVSYDGEWKEGSISGFGTMIYQEQGKKYVGDWVNFFRHGYGVLTFGEESDQLRYEGEMSGDEMSGNGTMTWKNGWKYVGEFLHDLQHGQGIFTFPENDDCGIESYNGSWVHTMEMEQKFGGMESCMLESG